MFFSDQEKLSQCPTNTTTSSQNMTQAIEPRTCTGASESGSTSATENLNCWELSEMQQIDQVLMKLLLTLSSQLKARRTVLVYQMIVLVTITANAIMKESPQNL